MDLLHVNGDTIPVFPQDRDNTILERIAAHLHTTPDMVWIVDSDSGRPPSSGDYTAVDVYSAARDPDNSRNLSEMQSRFAGWLESSFTDDTRTSLGAEEKQAELMRAHVETLHEFDDMSAAHIATLIPNVSLSEVEVYISQIPEHRRIHESLVKETRDNAERRMKMYTEGTASGQISEAVIEGSRVRTELGMTRYVPMPVIFDSLRVVRDGVGVRFARLGKMIKYHQGSLPPAAAFIGYPDEDQVNFERCSLVVGVATERDAAHKVYTTFRLHYANLTRVAGGKACAGEEAKRLEGSQNYFGKGLSSLIVEYTQRRGDVDPVEALTKYMPILTNTGLSTSCISRSLVATMVKPRFEFKSEIMNHIVFIGTGYDGPGKSRFALDERHNSSRGRVLMVHKATDTKVSLAVEKTNREMGPFTRVRLYDAQSKNIDIVSRDIAQLLDTYESSADNIEITYNAALPSNEPRAIVRVLRDSARDRARTEAVRSFLPQAARMPELFVPLYTRSVPKKRLPSIVDVPEDAKGAPVYRFPKARTGGTDPEYMTCPDPQFPHFGLKTNVLQNRDQFEFIPCCYAKDTSKQASMREYYEDAEATPRSRQALYTTSRILTPGLHGVLPPGAAMLFNILGPAPEVAYSLVPDFRNTTAVKNDAQRNPVKLRAVRCGVNYGPNSFIEAVLRAIHAQRFAATARAGDIYEPPQITQEMLAAERQKLSDVTPEGRLRMAAASQETWDMDPHIVSMWLADPNLFLEPRRFVRMLELLYEVNIFIFERNAKHVVGVSNTDKGLKLDFSETFNTPRGALSVPEHCPDGPYFHCKLPSNIKESYNNVFVYVHQGSDIDRSYAAPHVEYVLTDNMDNAVKLAHLAFVRMAMSTDKINKVNYNELVNRYAVPNETQMLDRGGRCVQIGNTILPEPIPPLPMPIVSRDRYDGRAPPRTSLLGTRVLQRLGRVLCNLYVHFRLESNNAPALVKIDPALYDWNSSPVIREFRNRPVWQLEELRQLFVDPESGALVLDSEDTRSRLTALSDIIIDNMSAEDRRAAKERDSISGYFQDSDDFSQYPGQLNTPVRMTSAKTHTIRERVVMFNTPTPVADRQNVLMINDNSREVTEIEYKAIHSEASMLKLLDKGVNLFRTKQESAAYVWDGSTWVQMTMESHLPLRFVMVYRVHDKSVFLVSRKNGSDLIDQIVEEF